VPSSSISGTLEFADRIDGWMTRPQAAMLAAAAREVGAEEIAVEIGSHHGKSTVVLAGAVAPGASVVAIDPFDDLRWGGGSDALDRFEANLTAAGVRERVRLHRARSDEVARSWESEARVRLLYVDGAHDYATASSDLTDWQPFLSDDAAILVHDAFSSVGVTRAVLRHLALDNRFRYSGARGTLVRFDRARPTFWSRVRLSARLTYFVRNVIVKLALRHGAPTVARALGHRGRRDPF
jgi:predicted O-methyltransferase YrrM